MRTDKTYVELKVTFIHIVVMVIGIVVIGAFLFYLGYQAGQSSGKTDPDLIKPPDKKEEIRVGDNDIKTKPKHESQARKQKDPSISDEIRLHQMPAQKKEKPKEPPKERDTIKPKQVTRSRHYCVQVGAFSDQSNAFKYAAKFDKMGYHTEILSSNRNEKALYKVRVGKYNNRAQALKELKKLEKMEKTKFKIINPD